MPQRLQCLNMDSFTHSSSYSSSFPNSRFQLSYPTSFLSTSVFSILFPLSICVSYPDKKVMNSFQTLSILYSVFLHHYLPLLWYYSVDITILLILAHKCRSHILQLNFALSIYVTVCQHLLRTSLKQTHLLSTRWNQHNDILRQMPLHRTYLKWKKQKKISFTMSLFILKIIIF